MPAPHKPLEDMTPEERLQSLEEWAEEQKYVRSGEGGTVDFGALRTFLPSSSSYAGPVRHVEPQYSAPIGPPSYETVLSDDKAGSDKKPGLLKKWLEKRKEKKAGKDQSGIGERRSTI